MSIHTSSLQNDERDINVSSPIERKSFFSASHLPFHQLQRASVRYHNGNYVPKTPSIPKHQRLYVNVDPTNQLEPLAAAKASVSSSSEHLKIINGRKDQFGVTDVDRYSKNHNAFLGSSSKTSGFASNAAAVAASNLSSSQSPTTPKSSTGTRFEAFSLNSKQLPKKISTSGSEVNDPLVVNAKKAPVSVPSTSRKPVRIKNQQSTVGSTNSNSTPYLEIQKPISKNEDYTRKTRSSYLTHKSLDHTYKASKSAYKYPNSNFGRNSEVSDGNQSPLETGNALCQSNAAVGSKEDDSISNSSFVKKAAKFSLKSSYSEGNDDVKIPKDEQSLLAPKNSQRSPHASLGGNFLPAATTTLQKQASNDRISDESNTSSVRAPVRNAAVIACNLSHNLKKDTGNTSQHSTLPSKNFKPKPKEIEISHSIPYAASTKTLLSSSEKKVQPQSSNLIPNAIPLAAARKIAISAKHSLQRLKDSHFNHSSALLFAFHAATQVSGAKSEAAFDNNPPYRDPPNVISSAHIAANQATNEKKDIPLRLSISSDPLGAIPIAIENKNSAALLNPSKPYRSSLGYSSPLFSRQNSPSEDVFYDAVDDEHTLDPPPAISEVLCDLPHNTEELTKTPMNGEVDKLGNYTDTESSEDRPSVATENPISSFKNSILNFSNDTAKALKWRLSGVLQPEKTIGPNLFYLHRDALDSSSAVHAAAIADRSFPVVQEKPPPLKTKALKKPSPHTLRRPTKKKYFFSKRSNGRFKNARVSRISKNVDIPRFVIDENRRKLYEGLWAANKGYLLRDSDVVYPENYVCDIVVRELWSRCGAPTSVLSVIYNLVDRSHFHMLNREEFIVGLFLIDQYLTGRKLPLKVPDSVWISSKRMGEMLWRLEQLQMKTRKKKNRFKRKVYKGLKWEFGSDQEDKGEEETATG
ncbi:ENTH/VHS domain-containing protein [Schizosaccharomyces osmophilus]|uniref:ENTH/VHS domain-containing protein n=1 Tax=Schizosaccharomyces osmophilus TaxID=2545709 RepID=A0AAE9WB98_9SCHI|nr:ENTH/VHS domain-containing protein [Schizosaccharomyces osmophilus]WBW72730.1 ENTH/VHS domain-containing protein [Schizosaccharomyces osmophilus]